MSSVDTEIEQAMNAGAEPYRLRKDKPLFCLPPLSYIKESGSVADPRTALVSAGLLGLLG